MPLPFALRDGALEFKVFFTGFLDRLDLLSASESESLPRVDLPIKCLLRRALLVADRVTFLTRGVSVFDFSGDDFVCEPSASLSEPALVESPPPAGRPEFEFELELEDELGGVSCLVFLVFFP